VNWWNNLPENKKDLLIGVVVGWESAVAGGSWYYANGNYYIETWTTDSSHDPTGGIWDPTNEKLGYAAVKTLHPEKTSGTITEADLAEVTYTHLADLAQRAMNLGLPRGKIFTHGQTFMGLGDNTYATVNDYSCPGWSYYGANIGGPRAEYTSLNNAVATSGAPSWNVPEFWWGGASTTNNWRQVMENILNPTLDPVCRYLNIYNWNMMNTNATILNAVQQVVQNSVSVCGDVNHPYPAMDFNHDCYVNLYDLDMFIEDWLNCTDPGLPCSYNP
jgi:hypothetical protein